MYIYIYICPSLCIYIYIFFVCIYIYIYTCIYIYIYMYYIHILYYVYVFSTCIICYCVFTAYINILYTLFWKLQDFAIVVQRFVECKRPVPPDMLRRKAPAIYRNNTMLLWFFKDLLIVVPAPLLGELYDNSVAYAFL